MYIPDSVIKNLETRPTDNDYIYAAEDMYEDLMSRTEENYKNYHMAVLANTLELYYKGVLQASGLSVDEHLMKKSHSLNTLYREISDRIQPLNNLQTESEKRDMRHFLFELSALYTDARYHYAQTSYEEFDKSRQFLSDQRKRCMTMLDPSMEWDKVKAKAETNNLPVVKYEPSSDAISSLGME